MHPSVFNSPDHSGRSQRGATVKEHRGLPRTVPRAKPWERDETNAQRPCPGAAVSRALRVVHLPARTPYVRKIVSDNFTVLNGVNAGHGVVPGAVTAAWLLDRRPLDWLDVLHLHHIELDDITVLERLLAECTDSGVKVVYTAHDITPMYCTTDSFRERMKLLAHSGVAWICLTAASAETLNDQIPAIPQVTVIPHGYVVNPDDVASSPLDARRHLAPRYLMYGALRASRDHLSTIANWSLSVTDPAARLTLLLRAISPADFQRHDVPALLALIKSEKRIQTTMRAYPSDAEIAAAGLRADALLLPYLYGSHSGQLELAFDLNLLPVCSAVGYLKDQYRLHDGLVTEPVWFDWSDGHPFLFGEQFVAALETAHTRLRGTPRQGPSAEFLEYRRQEHARFLDAHHSVYAAA